MSSSVFPFQDPLQILQTQKLTSQIRFPRHHSCEHTQQFFLFLLPLIWARLLETFEITRYLTDKIYVTNHAHFISKGKLLPNASLLTSTLIYMPFGDSRPPSYPLHYKVPLSTSNDGIKYGKRRGWHQDCLKRELHTPSDFVIDHWDMSSKTFISKLIVFYLLDFCSICLHGWGRGVHRVLNWKRIFNSDILLTKCYLLFLIFNFLTIKWRYYRWFVDI